VLVDPRGYIFLSGYNDGIWAGGAAGGAEQLQPQIQDHPQPGGGVEDGARCPAGVQRLNAVAQPPGLPVGSRPGQDLDLRKHHATRDTLYDRIQRAGLRALDALVQLTRRAAATP
jgi:hypothetical protein